jgi:uncharacterized repeat protein (TIGR01451 family)
MNIRKLYILFALTLGLLALSGVLALLGTWNSPLPSTWLRASVALAHGADTYTTYYVSLDGNCGGHDPCYTNVQAAVNAVDDPSDEVLVATGTYSTVNSYGGLAQVLYINKTLALRGGYSADFSTWDPEAYTTTLDARQQGRVVYISGDFTVTLEALHLTGGDADGLGGDVWGNAGGGVYVLNATATLSRSIVADNEVPGSSFLDDGLGGGVYANQSTLTLRHNQILNNRALDGGGMLGGSGMGGGLYCVDSHLNLEGNLIRENQATGDWGSGGGMELDACSDFTLTNNVIADNQADASGSGIGLNAMSGVPSSGRMLHTTIARNLVAGVEGVRVEGDSVVTMTNTILVGHDIGINVSFGSTATMTATIWANNVDSDDVDALFTGTINIQGDPAFLSPDDGDYHIGSSSDAVDKGVDAGVYIDLDGEPRDAQPDLGAYELSKWGLLVIKTVSPTLLNPSDTLTYTVAVTSAGALSVTNVVLTDTFPALQQPLNVTAVQGITCTVANAGYGGQVACDLDDLDSGQGGHITITAQVTTTVPATLPQTMHNTVQALSDQAQSSTYADTTLQDCHARVDGALPEYATVQVAVDAAGAGNEVWIAGTCAGAFERQGLLQQVHVTKGLTLRGGYSTDFSTWNPDAYTTTLDANGQGRVVYVDAVDPVKIEALSLTGGDATGQGGTFFVALGDVGGGVYALNSAVTLSRTHVAGNVASTRNYGYGGGVGVAGWRVTLINTTLADNIASSAPYGAGHGGGLSGEYTTIRLERSRLVNNAASPLMLGVGHGGGTFLYESDLEADATLWLSNTVSGVGWLYGGGLHMEGMATGTSFVLTNCVLADNWASEGGGLYANGVSGALIHPTIARNQGDEGVSIGPDYTTTVAITNAIVFSHTVGIRVTEGSTATVNGVLWHANITDTVGNVQVSHEYSGTPAFDADGYHLTSGSKAIDKGVGAGITIDIDGDPREGKPDIGADESPTRNVYLPLVLRNY